MYCTFYWYVINILNNQQLEVRNDAFKSEIATQSHSKRPKCTEQKNICHVSRH